MSTLWRNTLRFPVLIILSAILFQISAPARSQDEGVVRVDVKLVMIDATVKTKSGAIMGDLKKDNFEIREDGVPQKVEVFSRDELPLNVALVLDLSDSIGPFLGPLRDAAYVALSALKPDDQVALFTFATEAEMRAPLTTDKRKIADMISSFQARGATNINDGIFVAAQYLLRSPNRGRRVIILISDDVGTSAGGQGTRDIVTECIAADSVLYNLKIPGDNPTATILYSASVPGLVEIHKVMDQTGGEMFDVKNVANLDAAFRALIQRIKTRYTIGYYTKANGIEGKPHKLDVTLASSFGKKGKDYTLMAKNSFYVH
jgi:Ca-activated chloride channel family protein